ncbi:MAG: aquaporin, partial [Bryobacterales bacterium]|nr:aquaporin [Bryobacterales bacterium]
MRKHWPEYAMEGALLGLFMVSACCFALLLEHPWSPVRQAVADGTLRRLGMGVAMGATAVALILSPFGKRSGAHMNPATTATFWRLGKIEAGDAAGYMMGQFVGAAAAVGLVSMGTAGAIGHPTVNYVATVPGVSGEWVAFVAEAAISFVLMTAVLLCSNRRRLAGYTPFVAGGLVALYITVE